MRHGRRREQVPPRGALSALLEELARVPAEAARARAALRPGDVVGRFELVRRLGHGGFGEVHEAVDRELGRRVALKLLAPAPAGAAPRRARLLEDEAAAVAHLQHPNIVTLFDVGRSPHGPFLVFELLRGESVAERLRRGPLPPAEALEVAIAVSRALVHAHERGVLHRDLKPANVFLCADGGLKVLDFGIAQLFGRAAPVPAGTPGYMAPEQARGEREDARTDVYAVGVLLHQMISGAQALSRDGADEPAPLDVPGLPGVASVVRSAAAVRRAARPRDAAALLRALLAARAAPGQARATPPPRGGAAFAKITRPVLAAEVIVRPRLFRALDRASRAPVVWIDAPAGSGKTTLAAGWLTSRRLRGVWYQVDARDADPATFFYYLREAAGRLAPRKREPLPLLGPEYAYGLDVFARNFFELLGTRIPPGGHLVLDNFHELPEDAPLQRLLPDALAALPAGTRTLVLSRAAPPPALARLAAGRRLARVGAGELALTETETRALARRTVHARLEPSMASALRARTGGWMAGTYLLLEGAREGAREGALEDAHAPAGQRVLFDYFASELLDRADRVTQRLLVETSVLPQVTAATARALTGVARAGEILADLVRRSYFTLRLAGTEPRYQYHPLFREFLLSRARRDGTRWQELSRRAAAVLAAAGSPEDAAAVTLAAGDPGAVAQLVLAQAPALAQQGRFATIDAWLRTLPPESIASTPWLSYWVGVCRSSVPEEGRPHLERAYRAFRASADTTGMLLAWAAFVNTFFYVWDRFAPLDPWIDDLDALLRSGAGFPSAEVEAQATFGMLASLMWRRPEHPEIDAWAARAEDALARDGVAPETRMRLATYLAFFRLWWKGDHPGVAELLGRVQPLLARRSVSPLSELLWRVMESAFHARLCRPGACFAAVEAGLELAAASGIRGLNHTLALQGVYGGLAAGDLAAARRYHRLAAESLGPREAINNAHHRQLAAWVALCASDLAEAEAHAEAAFDHGRVSGASISVGWLEHTLATVRLEQGREAEGLERLDRALRWARDTRNPIVEHHCLLTQAWAHALRGRDDDAAAVLRIALALGRERGFATHPWIGWRRDAMARLDGIALARGIEPDQVRAGARARAGGLVGAGAPATASSRRSRTGSGRRRASSARRPR